MATVKTTRKKTAPHKPSPVSKPASNLRTWPRRLKLPAYKPFRLRRITYPEKLPSVWRLTARTAQLFWGHKRLFTGIGFIYALLTLILLVGSGSLADVTRLKGQIDLGQGKLSQLLTGVSVLAALFTTSGTSGNTGGAPQLIAGLIISLATIWGARQVLAGQKVSLRDAFYQGMYPLVPFALVFLVVLLEVIPLVVGGWLFVTVLVSGIATSGTEQLLWGLIFCILAGISLYLWCSSLFALYIVTLPDMRPVKALRSARQLVRYRRGQVIRKLLYLPVALMVVITILMLPAIIFAAAAAPWIFFALSTAALIAIHLYMYTLYKALLA